MRTIPVALLCAALAAQPLTRAESSNWHETSTNADVAAFVEAVRRLPYGDRLAVVEFGRSGLGRPLVAVLASLGQAPTMARQVASGRLRALISANIHAGEVEGKEAVQVLLREIAEGGQIELLQRFELVFVPVFNADGNDEIAPGHRSDQNGPGGGVGGRENAQGLDLNRDFMKLDTPEARALVRLMREFDPHLTMDLHTTNGSHHGYHLTYSPPLAINTDPDLAAFAHDRFLPALRARMLDGGGWRIFDYGNFGRGGPEQGWRTFSPAPRLLFNYVGLRNRLALLSEAYSYLSFADRVRVTRAFVVESLREVAAREDEVRHLCAQADARAAAGLQQFASAPTFAPAVRVPVLVGEVDRVSDAAGGERVVARATYRAVEAPVQVRFVAEQVGDMPAGWAVLDVGDDVAQVLVAHGLDVLRLTAPAEVTAAEFAVSGLARARRPFQGHAMVRVTGSWGDAGAHSLPAGALLVTARQPLARIAADLLEPASEDSLAAWGMLGERLRRPDGAAAGAGPACPVLRLPQWPATATEAVSAAAEAARGALAWEPVVDVPADAVTLAITCREPGRMVRSGDFESEPSWEGRAVVYRLRDHQVDDLDQLAAALAELRAPTLVLEPGDGITLHEVRAAAALAHRAGSERVLLHRR